jgi:hypothetical protein
MKAITIGFILAATAVGAAAQQLYEIRCRGGGLTISSTKGDYLPSGQRMHVTVKFKGGPTRQKIGTDGTRLNPGQCSWVDRDLRAGEPTEIRVDMLEANPDRRFFPPGTDDFTLAEGAPDTYTMPRYLAYSDHFWRFWVYNTGKGYLQGDYYRNAAYKPPLQRKGIDVIKPR